MMYRSGKLYREVMLSEDDIKALLNPTANSEEARSVRDKLRHHLDGPHDGIYDAVQECIDEGLSFRRDRVQLSMPDGTLVTLEVCPDGDVDAEGRPFDCTSVHCIWFVDDQRVEFNLDDDHEVIDQWRRQA